MKHFPPRDVAFHFADLFSVLQRQSVHGFHVELFEFAVFPFVPILIKGGSDAPDGFQQFQIFFRVFHVFDGGWFQPKNRQPWFVLAPVLVVAHTRPVLVSGSIPRRERAVPENQ
jgi:hypothetical protein